MINTLVMVRQMLRKVKIEAGDTKLLPGSLVDIITLLMQIEKRLKNVNAQLLQNQYYLVLLKHLETESFLSAASFQELLVYLLMLLLLKVNAMIITWT